MAFPTFGSFKSQLMLLRILGVLTVYASDAMHDVTGLAKRAAEHERLVRLRSVKQHLRASISAGMPMRGAMPPRES